MKNTRAYKAGESTARALIEMIHLMYQNRTAKKFMAGLMKVLSEEHEKRK